MSDGFRRIVRYHCDEDGVRAFFAAYIHAPQEADVEILGGAPEGHPEIRLLVVTLDHPTIDATTIALDAAQAKAFVRMLEEVSQALPDEAARHGVDKLAAGLREATERLEAGSLH